MTLYFDYCDIIYKTSMQMEHFLYFNACLIMFLQLNEQQELVIEDIQFLCK